MEKNVASQKIQLFAFDITTGAAKTGDAANITAYVSKDHGAVTVLGDTSASEMDATNAKGVYLFDLTQAETNANELTFTAKSSTGNISITPRFVTTTPPSFQAFVTPTGAAVNATQFAGQTITAAAGVTLPSSVASPTNITAGTITTVTTVTGLTASDVGAIKTKTDFLPSATAGAAGGVFIAGSNAATSITTALTANVIGNVTGNLSGSVGSVTGAVGSVTGAVGSVTGAVGSVTGAVGSVTGNVGGNVVGSVASVTARVTANTDQLAGQTVTAAAGVTFPTSVASPTNITAGTITTVTNLTNAATAGDLTATMKASVNTEADTALNDYDGPTNAELATALGTADDAVLAAVATAQTAIDAIPTNAELATALGTADDAVLAQVALVKAVTDKVDTTMEQAGSPLRSRFTAEALALAPTGGSAPSAATIADAVWDEALAGHAGVGSAGAALSAAGSAGDPWITPLPGAYGAGTAGKIVGDNINATISSRATQTSVDDLPTNAELATALGTADDAVLAAVATAQTAIDAIPTNAELATALGTADDAVLAAIAVLPQDKAGYALSTAGNAAVADKLLGRTLAGGGDGGRMVKDALRSLRNKTYIAAGVLHVTEEDDTTDAWTGAVTTAPGDPLTSIDPA